MAEPAVPMKDAALPSSTPSDRGHNLRMMLVVLGLAAGFAFAPRLTQGCTKSIGTEDAPDFTANVVANPLVPAQSKMTMSALRGQPVIIDFWATWCGPCRAESPIVNGISQRFKDKGLVVIGMNTSDSDGLAAKFASKMGLTFPILYDENNSIANKYHVENLPTLIVISKEGKMVAVRHGVTSDAELERLVRQVL
jgi:thiol-disulfide isomerase/thioredoxin